MSEGAIGRRSSVDSMLVRPEELMDLMNDERFKGLVSNGTHLVKVDENPEGLELGDERVRISLIPKSSSAGEVDSSRIYKEDEAAPVSDVKESDVDAVGVDKTPQGRPRERRSGVESAMPWQAQAALTVGRGALWVCKRVGVPATAIATGVAGAAYANNYMERNATDAVCYVRSVAGPRFDTAVELVTPYNFSVCDIKDKPNQEDNKEGED